MSFDFSDIVYAAFIELQVELQESKMTRIHLPITMHGETGF